MKFNGAAKQYAPLPQSQSDDELVRPDDRHHIRSPRTRTASGQSDGTHSLPDLPSANGGPELLRGNNKHASPCCGPDETSLDAPMSGPRKVCFVISLCASLLFVVGFGWLIPCRYGSLQPLDSIPTVVQEWSHVFSGLALTSNLETSFEDVGEKVSTVHLGFRRFGNDSSSTVGAMAVNGMTGGQIWCTGLYAAVALQKCLGDVCFVLGDGTTALLAALNKSDGDLLWYAHDHDNRTTLESISDMHIAPDCNDDGLPDLVIALEFRSNDDGTSSTTMNPAPLRAVSVVSRDDGRLLGSPVVLGHCTSKPRVLTVLEYGRNDSRHVDVLLYCHTHGEGGAVLRVLLGDLCHGVNRSTNAHVREIWSHTKKTAVQTATIPDDENPSLILAWGKGHLERLTAPNYNVQWNLDLMLNSPLRSLMVGHFKAYSSYELFVVSDHLHATLFQLINATNGKVEWRMQYDGTTAHVAHLVPAISRYVDGVLIKATTPLESSKVEVDAWSRKFEDPAYAPYLDHFHGVHHYDPKKQKLTVNTQEEQYFIVDFTNKTVNILSRLTVQQICLNGVCSPDIFSRKENAAMQVLHHRPGSYHLALATTSANRRSNASVPYDTVLKVVLLSHRKTASQCCGD
ncbi:unnamed protein product [Ixodes hexagonus]